MGNIGWVYPLISSSFSRRIFGHLMRLDKSLVRKTNVMDYSPLYLFFAIIQLLLLKIMDYPDHYESFSRRIFGHLMGLDHLLVRETNVMDYSHLYLFFAIIQLLLLKLWITITVMVRKSNSPCRLAFSHFYVGK